MLTISVYEITEEVYESANALVYRGRTQADNKPVIVKLLKQAYPPPEKIAWFKREYEITRSLNLPGVVDVYSLENDRDRLVMVLEDFGGESLKQLMQNRLFTLTEFLPLAIQVADILGQVHHNHIIHKDINPSNIVLNPKTGQLKLIDFGISTVLSRENQALRNPNVLEGTLAYIAPEQTGRMNRSIDYRTDFYSLGATFYELLTGQLPFEIADAMELVHSHIAKQPTPPHLLNPDIPQPLSEIVIKLMAKNAEDRYQSALGLKADLEECHEQWESTGHITQFPLGQQDFSDKFQISQRLYGREREIDTLLAGFERVSFGTKEMMLVAGYSGIGKSALVQEVYKPITRERGYFISGKFEQFQRDIPYASLVQAFRSLVSQLLTESESQIAAWREKLLAAFGDNGQVIIDVIPEVELIISSQPAVPELAPAEAQNRFNLVFQNFIKVFTKPEHPLVLFLDDLQWADGASLKLMELLMTAYDSQYLFIIGAYRDNEVSEGHPLMLTLDEIQKTQGNVNFINLKPLDLPNVNMLIADPLKCVPDTARPLAELVLAKTNGNPFFINEFLKSLYSENLLAFDLQRGGWQWNLEQIQARNITDNVVELMADKVQKLPRPTQQVLKLAACIGNLFDLQTLAIVCEKSPQETAAFLWEAMAEGLILPLSDAYKLIELEVQGLAEAVTVEYKFAHDRIQQAVYSLIPEADKQAVHWQVGQLLLQNTPPEKREQKIFDIVNQLNLGRDRISHQTERDELAQLNLMAGKKAKASAAYQPAFNYLQVGLSLLGEDSWERQYDLTLALYVEAAEAAYLSGHLDEMEQLAEVVLQRAKTQLDKVKIYEIKIQACITQSQHFKAVQIARQALILFGISFPEKPTLSDIQFALSETRTKLAGSRIEELIALPPMTEPSVLAVTRLLSKTIPATYMADPELFLLITFKMVNLSVEYGNADVSPFAYTAYGIILCGVVFDIESGYQFGHLALNLLDKLNVNTSQTRTMMGVNCQIKVWKIPIRETLRHLQDAYKIGMDNGDLAFAAYSATADCYYSYFTSLPLTELKRKLSTYVYALAELKQVTSVHHLEFYLQAVLNLIENSPVPGILTGQVYDESKKFPLLLQANDRYGLFQFYLNKLFLCYLFQDSSQAFETAALTEKYLDGVTGMALVAIFHFYDSLVQLAVFADAPESERSRILEKVAANQQKMEMWAHHAPMNYQHKFYLVEAERDRVLGKYGDAREYYDKAIALARENEFLQEEALANELAGKFYLAKKQNHFARHYLQEARYAYQRWGAAAKVKDLEARYSEFLVQTTTQSQTTSNLTSTGGSTSNALDFTSVLKASQAISGEIVLDKLLSSLMKILIENAGAQKGHLILETEGKLLIEASGAVDSDAIAVLQSIPIENCQSVSPTIINYVVRTKESVVLNDAAREGNFTKDPYIQQYQPKSILCAPLRDRGSLAGILYLENNLTAGAFTPDRLEMLNLLSSQAAISIANARLYTQLEGYSQKLEQKVEDRTSQLAEATRKAEAANEAKSAFLANMSHELRSPLNAILGFSQLMTRSQTLPLEQLENVGIITRSGEHLLTLINQVLDLSKIEAGRTTINEKNFDLYRLLDDLEDMFHLKADEKGLQLLCDRAPDVPRYIRTDEVKLRQVLINLLNNALKFTQEGGVSVRVGMEQGSKGAGEQGSKGDSPISNSRLVFEVEDTGPGIAPDELDSLFEAFVQTKTGKESQEGTGLGLPISRKFVQLMGGEVTVSSEVGKGTIFKFNIKVDIVDASDIETKQTTCRVIALEPNQPRYRILIVDDKQSNRLLLIKLLNPLGFELKEASNGAEAIEIWDTWEPHLIWMDMRMPVMDGYEATKRIKTTTKGQAIAIIAITASVLEEERAVVLSAGCDDFLRKPFREEDIFATMHKHIGVRYVYDEPTSQTAATQSLKDIQDALTPEAFAAVPEELLALLEYASRVSDMTKIDGYIDEIRSYNAPLADALATLALNFEYGKIVTFIQKAKE